MPDHNHCFIVTGSLTKEGSVAYLRADDSWALRLDEASPFATEAEAEAALARVKPLESIITEPYLFPARRQGGRILPVSAREILRAAGPSTLVRRPDPAAATGTR